MWVLKFKRRGVETRMWPQLGWFSGLMCVGSAVGAAAWGANMQSIALYYSINTEGTTRRRYYSINAASNR